MYSLLSREMWVLIKLKDIRSKLVCKCSLKDVKYQCSFLNSLNMRYQFSMFPYILIRLSRWPMMSRISAFNARHNNKISVFSTVLSLWSTRSTMIWEARVVYLLMGHLILTCKEGWYSILLRLRRRGWKLSCSLISMRNWRRKEGSLNFCNNKEEINKGKML